MASINTYATNAWYYGKVTEVIAYGPDGSFMVYINNTDLLGKCLYDRVNIIVSDMGIDRTKAALPMAMTALVSDRTYGICCRFTFARSYMQRRIYTIIVV